MFASQQGKDLSLLDYCTELFGSSRLMMRKQSFHERFNDSAVSFMKLVLARLLESQINHKQVSKSLTTFNRIRIKDSTRFNLPEAFSTVFEGCGGAFANSASMVSIQYEYDLLTQNTLDMRLTSGRVSDQSDAKHHTHDIQKDDLFIRDMGYATLGFMNKVAEGQAYFLNRLNTCINVYKTAGGKDKVDFEKYIKLLKSGAWPYLEREVYLGDKARIPVRLIVYPVNEDIIEQRLRKLEKRAKDRKRKVSDKSKERAQFTAYVTNIPKDRMTPRNAMKMYSLRWQIELIFKVWKGQMKINQVKKMSIQRFLCQLYANLIWLLIGQKIHWDIDHSFKKTTQADTAISRWKFLKFFNAQRSEIRANLFLSEALQWKFQTIILVAFNYFELEQKNVKHAQVNGS